MSKRPHILLINPWITDFAAYDFWLKPLGLLSIAAVIRARTTARLHFIDCLDHGSEAGRRKADGRGPFPKVEIPKPAVFRDVPRRFSRYGISIEEFKARLDRMPVPEAVLLTGTMTYWYPGIQTAVELIRAKFEAVPIILGGIYATLCEDHARRNSGADRIVTGPGENAVLTVLREILGAGVIADASPQAFRDLPSPAWDLLPDRLWLPVLSSRGCPLRCSFCAGRLLFDGFQERRPAEVAAEIAAAHAHFGTRHFAFYDDALLLHKKERIIPILEDIISRGLDASFHLPNGLHIREIDDELARLFQRAGVRSIYLSQESTDAAVLASACPKVSAGDLERAAAALENAGFAREDLNVYLIAGLPGQDAAGLRADLNHVRRLGLRPRLAYFSPIPGTDVWRELVAAGRLDAGADPLLHNKAAYPYTGGSIAPEDWAMLHALQAAAPERPHFQSASKT